MPTQSTILIHAGTLTERAVQACNTTPRLLYADHQYTCGHMEAKHQCAEAVRALLSDALQDVHIVFDGPPGPDGGRFVEAETADGKSIRVGRWEQRGDYWHLILQAVVPA